MEKYNIAVLGAGSWGITLAILLHENEHRVVLWELYKEHANEIRKTRESPRFLPGIRVPETIPIETDLTKALVDADMIVFVVPSHGVRSVARMAADSFEFTERTYVVNAAKGLEEGTLKRMSEVLRDELPVRAAQVLTLSGPSHAEEVSRHMPTSVVVAGIDGAKAVAVRDAFFRRTSVCTRMTTLLGSKRPLRSRT